MRDVPTRQGILAAIGAAISFAIARVFGVPELFIIGSGLVLVVVAAVVVVNVLRPRVLIDRVPDAEVFVVGDPARMTLRIAPMRGWSPALELIEPVGASNQARLGIGRLTEPATVAYSIPTERRGVVPVGPLLAVRRDVLGLAQQRRVVAPRLELAVAPRAIPISMPVIGRGPLGRRLTIEARRIGVDDFHGLREYVPGDELRSVHWKASARSGELKVKQYEHAGLKRCVVVLDMSAGPESATGDFEPFEIGATAAASVMVSAEQSGLTTRMVAGADVDLRGPHATVHALDFLARAEPVASAPAPVIERDPGDGLGLVVVIATDRHSAVWSALGPLTEPGVVVVGVLTSPGATASGALDIVTPDGSTFASRWAALVGERPRRPNRARHSSRPYAETTA